MKKLPLLYLLIIFSFLSCKNETESAQSISCSQPTEKEIKDFLELFISENIKSNQIIVSTPIENIENFHSFSGNYVLSNLPYKSNHVDSIDLICMKEQSLLNIDIKINEQDTSHNFVKLENISNTDTNQLCFITRPYFNKEKNVVCIGIEYHDIQFEQTSGFILIYRKENRNWKIIDVHQHIMS